MTMTSPQTPNLSATASPMISIGRISSPQPQLQQGRPTVQYGYGMPNVVQLVPSVLIQQPLVSWTASDSVQYENTKPVLPLTPASLIGPIQSPLPSLQKERPIIQFGLP